MGPDLPVISRSSFLCRQQHHQPQQQQQPQQPQQHYRYEHQLQPHQLQLQVQPERQQQLSQHQHQLLYQAAAAGQPASHAFMPTHIMYLIMPNGNVAAFQLAPHPNQLQVSGSYISG